MVTNLSSMPGENPFRKTFLWLFILAWVLGVMTGETWADPRIDVKIKYYKVRGETVEELRKELTKKTPIRNNGQSFDANTTWYVKWNTQWAMKGMSCSIISVTTRVSIVFTLPKWANSKDADAKEREKWAKFFKQLVEHENGHKDIAVGSAKEIERVVMNMESRKDCETLKRDSNRLGQTIIEKYHELTQQYDIETDHGRKKRASEEWKNSFTLSPAQ